MQSALDVEHWETIPPALRGLIGNPQPNPVSFDALNEANIDKAVGYVRTKTMMQLLNPPTFSEREMKKIETPIVLVFCQPSEELNLGKNEILPYAPVSYGSWLQGAGAKCVPLPYNINEGSLQFLLERAHGLLIPGGGSNLYKSYEKKQGFGPITVGFLKVWRQILKMWAKGIHFPVWGTCLGLQIVLIALANDSKVLSNLNSRGHQVQIYPDYQRSAFLSALPLNLRLQLENRKLINFAHMHGITVKKFLSWPKLVQKMRIVGISKDKDGKWFCSALQGRDKPLFLSQFHPEKQAYQWTRKGDIVANKPSIEISQYLAQSFIKQCQRCKAQRTFSSQSELHFHMLQQYRQIYTPERHYKIYAIDFRYRDYDRQQKKKLSQKIVPSTKKILI